MSLFRNSITRKKHSQDKIHEIGKRYAPANITAAAIRYLGLSDFPKNLHPTIKTRGKITNVYDTGIGSLTRLSGVAPVGRLGDRPVCGSSQGTLRASLNGLSLPWQCRDRRAYRRLALRDQRTRNPACPGPVPALSKPRPRRSARTKQAAACRKLRSSTTPRRLARGHDRLS